MLKEAFDNREMKSENGFSLAIASQPFQIDSSPDWDIIYLWWEHQWHESRIKTSKRNSDECLTSDKRLYCLKCETLLEN